MRSSQKKASVDRAGDRCQVSGKGENRNSKIEISRASCFPPWGGRESPFRFSSFDFRVPNFDSDTSHNLWYDSFCGWQYPIHSMSNSVMANSIVSYLVPAGTTSEGSGQGAPLELGALAGKALLLILQIDEVLEQESLRRCNRRP